MNSRVRSAASIASSQVRRISAIFRCSASGGNDIARLRLSVVGLTLDWLTPRVANARIPCCTPDSFNTALRYSGSTQLGLGTSRTRYEAKTASVGCRTIPTFPTWSGLLVRFNRMSPGLTRSRRSEGASSTLLSPSSFTRPLEICLIPMISRVPARDALALVPYSVRSNTSPSFTRSHITRPPC